MTEEPNKPIDQAELQGEAEPVRDAAAPEPESAPEQTPPVHPELEEEKPPMDWYILKVQSNRENSIADALQRQLAILQTPIPSEFLLMAPYIVTIVVVAGLIGRSRPPAAEGTPYVKE